MKALMLANIINNKCMISTSFGIIISIGMIEFGKIFCDLHPNELITNYCCREECNIGLCATCICSHTESHIQRNTAPDYQNIRNTYSNMQDALRTRISALEQQKSRINILVENIRNKKKHTQEVIIQARHETLDFVNRFFDAKEKEVLRKMEADEKKLGLHNENRMDALLNIISRDVNGLFAAAQDLNSQDFLESFHRIRTQVIANSLQTQRDISEELDKNQNYEVTALINPIYINDIKMGLQKSLIFSWDDKKGQQKQPDFRETKQYTNRSSRIMIPTNSNQGSVVTTQPRHSESLPKHNITSQINQTGQPQQAQLNRSSSHMLEPYNVYMMKQSSTPIQLQAQSPTFRFQPQQYMPNNSMPVQIQPRSSNLNSRIEFRVNSTQKNVKENGRLPMAQSYMDVGSYNLNASSQLERSKKVRRSGLTVLRQVDNEAKN